MAVIDIVTSKRCHMAVIDIVTAQGVTWQSLIVTAKSVTCQS